jgi:hypothetical protein
MSWAEFDAYSGWLGHQHAAENAHGDPGDFTRNIAYLLSPPAAQPTPPKEFDMPAGFVAVVDAFDQQHQFTVDPMGRLVHWWHGPGPGGPEVLGHGLDPDRGVTASYIEATGQLQVWTVADDGAVVLTQYKRPGPWQTGRLELPA